jgi:hypothetical protein
MTSKIWRLVIIASLGAALSGLTPVSAQAAVPTTTLPATAVTAATALLNGTVSTGGAAILWQFQYGTTTAYGQNTAITMISAGHGTVTVLAKITGLKPGTTYHYRLATQLGDGTNYFPLRIIFGTDQTFTTKKLDELTLSSTKLSVNKAAVSIGLKCASTQSCKGKLTLSARVKVGKKFEGLTFASKSFSISAGSKLTLKPHLTKRARTLLKHARGQRLGVKLTAKFSTGQPTLSKSVTLILK